MADGKMEYQLPSWSEFGAGTDDVGAIDFGRLLKMRRRLAPSWAAEAQVSGPIAEKARPEIGGKLMYESENGSLRGNVDLMVGLDAGWRAALDSATRLGGAESPWRLRAAANNEALLAGPVYHRPVQGRAAGHYVTAHRELALPLSPDRDETVVTAATGRPIAWARCFERVPSGVEWLDRPELSLAVGGEVRLKGPLVQPAPRPAADVGLELSAPSWSATLKTERDRSRVALALYARFSRPSSLPAAGRSPLSSLLTRVAIRVSHPISSGVHASDLPPGCIGSVGVVSPPLGWEGPVGVVSWPPPPPPPPAALPHLEAESTSLDIAVDRELSDHVHLKAKFEPLLASPTLSVALAHGVGLPLQSSVSVACSASSRSGISLTNVGGALVFGDF